MPLISSTQRLAFVLRTACLTLAILAVLGGGTSHACVGSGCMQIWSTADGGGALAMYWDFTKKVQTYESFCAPDNSLCLYSTIDPGFMAPPSDPPPPGLYRLSDGTKVRIQIVSAAAGVSLNVNGQKLSQPGESALLGTMPTIHNHPSWQVVVPGGAFDDYPIQFELITDSPAYTDSPVYTQIVTNLPPAATETPTPSEPTPTPATRCVGDCDGNGTVTVSEIVLGVNMVLSGASAEGCPALDSDHDGVIRITEILQAVNQALGACPTPVPATLDEIQETIFTPSCAIPFCHDAQSHTGNLMLTSTSQSYDQLVNVDPDIVTARLAGLLRVKPGEPDASFLLIKLQGPPPDQGSRMPLTGPLLTAEQIDLIRNWILQGAQP